MLPIPPITRPLASPATPPCSLADHERQPCEIWTRVMGYHRPVSSFNRGKRAEHAERRFFQPPATPAGLTPIATEPCLTR